MSSIYGIRNSKEKLSLENIYLAVGDFLFTGESKNSCFTQTKKEILFLEKVSDTHYKDIESVTEYSIDHNGKVLGYKMKSTLEEAPRIRSMSNITGFMSIKQIIELSGEFFNSLEDDSYETKRIKELYKKITDYIYQCVESDINYERKVEEIRPLLEGLKVMYSYAKGLPAKGLISNDYPDQERKVKLTKLYVGMATKSNPKEGPEECATLLELQERMDCEDIGELDLYRNIRSGEGYYLNGNGIALLIPKSLLEGYPTPSKNICRFNNIVSFKDAFNQGVQSFNMRAMNPEKRRQIYEIQKQIELEEAGISKGVAAKMIPYYERIMLRCYSYAKFSRDLDYYNQSSSNFDEIASLVNILEKKRV